MVFGNNIEQYGNIFGEAYNWKYIELKEDNSYYKVEDNILYSSDGKKLILVPTGRTGEFNIPESVEEIKGNAFYTSDIKKSNNAK